MVLAIGASGFLEILVRENFKNKIFFEQLTKRFHMETAQVHVNLRYASVHIFPIFLARSVHANHTSSSDKKNGTVFVSKTNL